MNCTGCRRDFASLSAFDRHRAGVFPQTGPADYLDRMSAGLAPLDDWQPKPEFGRRCLADDELAEAGLELDKRGRWRVKPTAAQLAFWAKQSAAETTKARKAPPLREAA